MQMICIGECGSFNPLLLQDLTDSIQVLNQDNLKQGHRIYFRFSPLCLRIQAFDFLINKVKVYCSIYFLNK